MPKFKKSTGYTMKGFSYPGKSPLKQGIEHIDPLDLGLIDEAKKVKVKKPSTTVKTTTLPGGHHHKVTKGPGAKVPPQSASKPYEFKTSTKQISKVVKKGGTGGNLLRKGVSGVIPKNALSNVNILGKGTRKLSVEALKKLSNVGKFLRGGSLIGAAYGLFEGYGHLSKTKHGKEIIKGGRTMPGKI